MNKEIDLDKTWALFDDAQQFIRQTTVNPNTEDESFLDDQEHECEREFSTELMRRTCIPNNPLFPKNSSCTFISMKGSTSRMRRIHMISSLDNREYNLYKDAMALKQRLCTGIIALSSSHIELCVEVYARLCKKLQAAKCQRSKIHIGIGVVYYTLKQSINPTIPEICTIFSCNKRKVMIAIKKFRVLCAEDPEMSWIFDHEIGQTNLYRYGETMDCSWKSMKAVENDMLQRGKMMTDNNELIRTFKKLDKGCLLRC